MVVVAVVVVDAIVVVVVVAVVAVVVVDTIVVIAVVAIVDKSVHSSHVLQAWIAHFANQSWASVAQNASHRSLLQASFPSNQVYSNLGPHFPDQAPPLAQQLIKFLPWAQAGHSSLEAGRTQTNNATATNKNPCFKDNIGFLWPITSACVCPST